MKEWHESMQEHSQNWQHGGPCVASNYHPLLSWVTGLLSSACWMGDSWIVEQNSSSILDSVSQFLDALSGYWPEVSCVEWRVMSIKS